jgi:UDP-2,3-diacylglucosamine hydrolase
VTEQAKAVFFVSDAHLGSGPNHDLRVRTLVAFLHGLSDRASHLYVLGDLFDFWFEYRHAIPKGHFRVLRALADLVDAGVQVAYLGGNHDFWCGSHLSSEVGLEVHQKPFQTRHQGRRIFLAHGDGIGPGDTGYRLLKAVLRSRLSVFLYRTLHPDFGIPFAYRVSRISRNHTAGREVLLARMSRHLVAPRYAAGDDAVLIGHIHDPIHLQDARERDFLILGDWLENFTYVRLQGGTFSLERYLPDATCESIPARSWPEPMAPSAP